MLFYESGASVGMSTSGHYSFYVLNYIISFPFIELYVCRAYNIILLHALRTSFAPIFSISQRAACLKHSLWWKFDAVIILAIPVDSATPPCRILFDER